MEVKDCNQEQQKKFMDGESLVYSILRPCLKFIRVGTPVIKFTHVHFLEN